MVNLTPLSVLDGNCITALIEFSASVTSAGTLVWNFGDDIKPESGNHTNHSFKHEGSYTVIATLNEIYIQSLKITIKGLKDERTIINPVTDFTDVIISADISHVGESVLFSSAKLGQQYSNMNVRYKTHPNFLHKQIVLQAGNLKFRANRLSF